MKFLLIPPINQSIYNFRGDLIREIQNKGFEVLATGPDKANMDEVLALGVRFFEAPMERGGTSFFRDLKYCLRLRKIMKTEKVDITLGYTLKPVIYGAIAAKLAGVKNINSMVTGAGYVFTSGTFKAKVLRVLLKFLLRIGFACSNNVIFQNSDDRDEFISSRLVKPDKCHVVNGSGVDLNKFAFKSYPEDITFFMCARLLVSKGVREFLQAARNIKSKYPHVKFALLGGFDNVPDSLKEEDIASYVRDGIVEKHAETHDVRPYFHNASIYVLPSYREGTPRTVLEAMAMARAVITTDTNGCRQTVVDGYNGFLIAPQNIKALEEKMEYFILHPDKIKEMGENSLKLCREKFDVVKVNQEMLRIMDI